MCTREAAAAGTSHDSLMRQRWMRWSTCAAKPISCSRCVAARACGAYTHDGAGAQGAWQAHDWIERTLNANPYTLKPEP